MNHFGKSDLHKTLELGELSEAQRSCGVGSVTLVTVDIMKTTGSYATEGFLILGLIHSVCTGNLPDTWHPYGIYCNRWRKPHSFSRAKNFIDSDRINLQDHHSLRMTSANMLGLFDAF